MDMLLAGIKNTSYYGLFFMFLCQILQLRELTQCFKVADFNAFTAEFCYYIEFFELLDCTGEGCPVYAKDCG